MPGFTETMAILDFLNITAAIVSGGLNHLAHRIAKIGHIQHVFANGLAVDDNGYLTGEGILQVKLRQKDEIVKYLTAHLGIESKKIAAIGNGEIDIPMFEVSGLGIGFNPQDERLIECADVVIHNKNLTEVVQYICDFESLPVDLKGKCVCSK